jgi:hypothetical protein
MAENTSKTPLSKSILQPRVCLQGYCLRSLPNTTLRANLKASQNKMAKIVRSVKGYADKCNDVLIKTADGLTKPSCLIYFGSDCQVRKHVLKAD